MSMFRHKTIAHFRVADFEFRNHILKITEKDGKSVEDRVAEFRQHCEGLRRIDQVNIVEVNEAALAALEKPMGGRVIKGFDNSAANKTPSTSGAIRPVGLTDEELAAQKKSREDLDSATAALAAEKKQLEEERAKFEAFKADESKRIEEEKARIEKAVLREQHSQQDRPDQPPALNPATPPTKPAPQPASLKLPADPIPGKK